jgi:hypothetical protein
MNQRMSKHKRRGGKVVLALDSESISSFSLVLLAPKLQDGDGLLGDGDELGFGVGKEMRMRKKKSSLSLSLPFIEGGVSS